MAKSELLENTRQRQGGIRPLTPREFEQIRRLAHAEFGLNLSSGKEELVSARLSKQIRQWGFRTFQQYFDHVLADRSGEALSDMIDALATNHTMFLREPAHFDFLRNTIAAQFRRHNPLEIWSAACATGEEPYSIAMCLLEELGWQDAARIRVVASDISTRALETARQAVYAASRFENFPTGWLHEYFLKGEKEWKGWYRVKAEVRRLVDFRRLNLMEPLESLPPFAAIFCRNVMIYFDKPTQEDLMRRLVGRLEPGGYLLVGLSESLLGSGQPVEYVRPAVYRKPHDSRGLARRGKDEPCAQ